MKTLIHSAGVAFGASLLLSYGATAQESLLDQVNSLNQAVCLQNWENALTLVNRIIASASLSDDDRTFYVNYRRQLLDYNDRKVRLDPEDLSGCEEVLKTIETETLGTQTSQAPSQPSNFDWDQEIAKISNSAPSPEPPTSPVARSTSSPSSGTSPVPPVANTEPILELKEDQGVFLRPTPSSNIPLASIRGNLVNSLPIEAENIVVHYDVYQLSKDSGPNSSNIYDCFTTEQYQRVTDKLSPNAQTSIFIEEPGFVQIVGITWEENGDRAFVRVSEFQNTGNVIPCSPWQPYSYYNYYDRQAVDPQIRLR